MLCTQGAEKQRVFFFLERDFKPLFISRNNKGHYITANFQSFEYFYSSKRQVNSIFIQSFAASNKETVSFCLRER